MAAKKKKPKTPTADPFASDPFAGGIPLGNGGGGGGGSTGTQYLGNVPHARVSRGTVKQPFGSMAVTAPGYKKGDQVKLLPTNGAQLAQLQQSLYQAGYINDAQYGRMVLGSPDEVTTAAFAKLLATSNMGGLDWREALSQRLAAQGDKAPGGEGDGGSAEPLRISLDDPETIKQTLDVASRKLLGGYMTPEQKDAFVAQFQAQQTAQQTAYQTTGGAIAQPDLGSQAVAYAKTTDPNQYKATQFGSQVHQQLESLRATGNLSNQENNL